MSSIYLFAAEDDWLPVFDRVESRDAVEYVAAGVFSVDQLTVFSSGAALPNRGRATAQSVTASPGYLAARVHGAVRTEAVTANDGVTRYYVTQGDNPLTIEVNLGGDWHDGVLIAGRIATISDSVESQALYRQFGSALRHHFVQVRAFLVGPAAHRRLLAGWRLTVAANASRELDLAPE